MNLPRRNVLQFARLAILALGLCAACAAPALSEPEGERDSTYTSLSATGSELPVGSGVIVAGTGRHAVDGVNTARNQDQLIAYTPVLGQTTTATNTWGAEVVVIGGKVTSVVDRQVTQGTGIAIPSNGYVLSGHNTSRDWLLANAKVGTTIRLANSPVTGAIATIGSGTHVIDGFNAPRLADQLVAYTRIGAQTTTPTNVWGVEISVIRGTVTSIVDRQATMGPPMTIPSDGYVLSGHNVAAGWLRAHAAVGATVTYGEVAPAPVPTTTSPAPSPTPPSTSSPPPNSSLPAKLLGVYFFMYNSPRLAAIQAEAPQYNLVYYAFALGTNNGGSVTFSVPSQAGGDAAFRTDIVAWKASGRIAVLSVGGGSDTGLRLRNDAEAAQFMTTIVPVIDTYGFQGIDWDLEQSAAYTTSTVVSISRQLKAKYGSKFVISMAPRPYEFRSYATPRPYYDIAKQLGADCDLIGFQFYDYPESRNESQQRSIIRSDINDAIKGFPASKLLIGAEAPNAGLAWSPASVYRDAYNEMNASTGGLRGAFIWDSPNERASAWTFAKTMGPALGR